MSVCQSITARNNDRINAYTQRLYGAVIHGKSQHLTYYRGNTPELGKAVAQAELHAALMRAYGLYKDGVAIKNSSSLGSVYAAFNTIYPGKYRDTGKCPWLSLTDIVDTRYMKIY